MRLSPFVMLIFSIILYNILWDVNSAGVPSPNYFTQLPILNENNTNPAKTPFEYLNNFDYKLEAMGQIINKMDNSLQNLQENARNWIIFQHHINSWNEGIRILENKIDILKRTHEEQQQQLQNLDLVMKSSSKIYEGYDLLLNDVKEFLISERKNKNEISLKINNILRYIQLTSVCNNEKKTGKNSNIVAAAPYPQQCLSTGCSHKIEQRLNVLSNQMALQKDLKQLNSLERRNSKNLENVNQVLNNHSEKYDEIAGRLQKSNECCSLISSELTTFTESSDILLKHIEKLVRDISDRINNIEEATNSKEQTDDKEDIGNESDETEIVVQLSNEDLNDEGEHELEETNFKTVIDVVNIEKGITEGFEYDDSHDVEFIRPNLNGCHQLLDDDDDSTRIDGIYKFSQPNLNYDGRDFNERYCVFANSLNDTGLPWTVIQRRGPYQQQENFNRSWAEYRNGFGNLSKDFWYGNEFIHRLVYFDNYELRIELEDFEGIQMWAEYSLFRVDYEKFNYNLLIGGYNGSIEDAMKYHSDNDFSTYDKRNDKTIDGCCSCASGYASGWWFNNCSEANLNGIYRNTPLGHNYSGIIWELWRGDYSLKKSRMMIRPLRTTTNRTVVNSHEYTEDP